MLMIVAHHVVAHGLMHYKTSEQFIIWAQGAQINKIFSAFLFPGGEVGVAIFFIITGYFSINKAKGTLLKIITQTLFYGLLFLLVFTFLKLFHFAGNYLNMNSFSSILKTILLPGTGGSYWFITAYVAVILLIPLINPFLNSLNELVYFRFLLFAWFFWYSLAAFFDAPFFSIQKGLFFYSVGAYISRFEKRSKSSLYWIIFFLGWLAASFVAFGIASTGVLQEQTQVKIILYKLLVAFETSIPVPVCSIAVFYLFKSLDIGSNSFINSVASTTFGVYLIHDSGLWRKLIWYQLFKVDTVLFLSKWFPVISIFVIIIVFFTCSIIDLIRQKAIEPFLMAKALTVVGKIRENVNRFDSEV